MTNRAGPEYRGVTIRPTPVTPSASDTWFQDCTGGDPSTGTLFEQGWFNGLLAKLRDTFTAAHPTLLPVDDSMLTRSINTLIQMGSQNWALDTGSADALAVTLSPAPFAQTDGMRVFLIKGSSANSGTVPTLNVNGAGAQTIVDRRGNALAPGDLPANAACLFELRSGQWRVISPPVYADIVRATPYTGRTQYFYSSGTFTVPTGVTSLEVDVFAGGGGGGASCWTTAGGTILGNCGGGGSGGAFGRKRIFGLSPGAAITVTVGAGGTAPTNSNGGTGGTSSFGSYVTCTGGLGGPAGINSNYGQTGGTSSGGDMNIIGSAGGFSGPNDVSYTASYGITIYNKGALSAGGLSGQHLGGTGMVGVGYGAGGTGASGGSGIGGGPGSPGLVIVRW